MILANPIIFGQSLQAWLGVLTFLFLILQILTGTRILKIPMWWHRKVFWIILLILAILHAFYGIQNYYF